MGVIRRWLGRKANGLLGRLGLRLLRQPAYGALVGEWEKLANRNRDLETQLARKTRVLGPGELQPLWQGTLDAHRLHCEQGSLLDVDGRPLGQPHDVLAMTDLPVIVGPWLSEVGFELLYWVPLLRAHFRRLGVGPERVIALSRGGVRSWYAGVAARYADVFDFCEPEEFLTGNQDREGQQKCKKQLGPCPFGSRMVRQTAERFGLSDYLVLHPCLMYNLFRPFWSDLLPQAGLRPACDFSLFPDVPPLPEGLPFTDYIAVKVYHSDCFPDTPENERFTRRLIDALASRAKVVLLNTGLKLDDHNDAPVRERANVFDAAALMTPRDNLHVQTAILAHARRFYGTYGGFSYLAPFLGVPSLAFYSERNFIAQHRNLADQVFNAGGAHRFDLISTTYLNAFLDGAEIGLGRRVAA